LSPREFPFAFVLVAVVDDALPDVFVEVAVVDDALPDVFVEVAVVDDLVFGTMATELVMFRPT